MRALKYVSLTASAALLLSGVPAIAQNSPTKYQITDHAYTANPPGPGAQGVGESNLTRSQVEATKRQAEKEIQQRAQISGADTQVANKDIKAGNQMLDQNKLPEAQRFYKAAMSSIEDPHTMSMGTHATANNPNVTGTNGFQK